MYKLREFFIGHHIQLVTKYKVLLLSFKLSFKIEPPPQNKILQPFNFFTLVLTGRQVNL